MKISDLQLLENRLKKSLQETIITTVNGKIDRIEKKIDTHNEKHEEDMLEVREHMANAAPVIEAYNAVGNVGAFIKWVGGVATAISVLWLLLTK